MSESLFINALPDEIAHIKHIAHCITGIDAVLNILADAVTAETLLSVDPRLSNQSLYGLLTGAREQAYLMSRSFDQLGEIDLR